VTQAPAAGGLRGFLKRHAIDTRTLRYPAYRRLFIGNAFGFFGYQFTAVAVYKQMYDITRSDLWVGMLGLAGLVPLVAFSLWGGAVADAFDRRRVLVFSSLTMWAATLGLLGQALLGQNNRYLILVLVAVQAAAFAVTTPTRSAIVPRLMPADEVASAQTLSFTMANAATVAGPLAAGLLVAAYPISWAYAVDAVAYTIALWAAFRLPELPVENTTGKAGRFKEIAAGLKYLAGSQLIMLTFAIDIAAMVLALPRALFPGVAATRFGEGSLGWLFAAIAIGSVAAGLFSGWINRVHRQGVALVGAVVVWGLAVAAAGAAPWLWLAVVMLAVAGAGDLVSAVYRQTLLLTYAPDEMRGRLQGVFFAVVAGGPRLGDLRAGAMAHLTGATIAWVGGGLAAAAVAVLLAAVFPALLRYTPRTE
jgi:MFS family permease